MNHIVQRFVEDAARTADCSTLGESFEEAILAYGFDRYVYFQLPVPGRMDEAIHLSNYPASWVSHYTDARYDAIDPVLKNILASPVPFDWQTPSFMEERESHAAFFDEAAQVGIRSGLTIPFHFGDSQIGALCLAGELETGEADRNLDSNRDILNLLGFYFYVHIERVLRLGRRSEFSLTPREIECLKWQANGKTMWEVSRILSISEQTVQFHVENAKTKLSATTVPHAVAIAVKNELISV